MSSDVSCCNCSVALFVMCSSPSFLWLSYLSSSFYANVCPIPPCVCVCASVCVCSLLIQGSGWSCCPRGRSLVKPTQFFHIRHCNCSCWPGCLRLGTQTYTLINTRSQTYACASTYVTQEPLRVYLWLLSSDVLCFYSSISSASRFCCSVLVCDNQWLLWQQKMSDSCICEPFFLHYNLVCNNLLEIKLTGVHMLYLCIFWLWWIKCVVCCLGPPLSKSEEALSFDWLLKDKSNSNSTQSRLQSPHIVCLKYGYGFWLRKIKPKWKRRKLRPHWK